MDTLRFDDILEEAIRTYNPTHAFCFFSGGKDSTTSTHLTMGYMLERHPEILTQVCHINTGIGVEETREFVRETCTNFGWPLCEYKTDPAVYDDLCTRFGFPGPGMHGPMYRWLKERQMYRLIADYRQVVSAKGMGKGAPRRNRILFVTGVRKQESRRRMGNVEPIQAHKAMVWVAPIVDWTKDDCLDYIAKNRIPTNEVSDVLHMSGECLCGSFASEGELDMIRAFYPGTAKRIEALQEKVIASGQSHGWGGRAHEVRTRSKKFNTATLCVDCSRRG